MSHNREAVVNPWSGYSREISMCNQMVTSEIREQFHARFVQILTISRDFRRRKLLGFGQNASEIIP